MTVSNEKFILPKKSISKTYDKNITRNLKALYFSMSRSEKKDLFLGDLYNMVLPHYDIDNFSDFFNFVAIVLFKYGFYDKKFLDEIAMSACYFCRYSPYIAPVKFGMASLTALRVPALHFQELGSVTAPKLYRSFFDYSNISEIF